MKKHLGLSALGIYFGVYCLAIWLEADLWTDLLSPGALIAAALLLYTYRHSESLRFMWLCLGVGCLCYGLADVTWVVYNRILGINAEDQPFIQWMYLGANLAMVLVVGYFLSRIAARLNIVQLLLDILAISATSTMFFWGILMRGDLYSFMNQGDVLLALTMLTDFFILTGMALWVLSANIEAIPASFYLAIAGIVIYSLTDLQWAYMSFYQTYAPNTFIDAVYVLSLLLIGWGANRTRQLANSSWPEALYKEIRHLGAKRKGILLLILPLLLLSIRGLDQYFALMMAIFVGHQILSSFVQNAAKSDQLRTNQLYLERSQRYEVMAYEDALTKLPNRRYFMAALEKARRGYQDFGAGFAVVFLDVDGFKDINDNFGHDIGDLLLVEMARVFRASIRKKDVIARLGGDEFVLLFFDLVDEIELQGIVRRLRNQFTAPVRINNCICSVGLSAGIGKFPEDSQDVDELLKIADKRMYREKMSKKFKNHKAN